MFTHPRSELRWSNLSYKNPPIRSIVSSSLSDDLFSRCFCIMNVISASSRVQFMSWVNDPVASMGPRPYSQWSNNFNGPSMTPLLGGFSSPFFFWTEQIQFNEFWLQVKSLASSSNPQGFSQLGPRVIQSWYITTINRPIPLNWVSFLIDCNAPLQSNSAGLSFEERIFI